MLNGAADSPAIEEIDTIRPYRCPRITGTAARHIR